MKFVTFVSIVTALLMSVLSGGLISEASGIAPYITIPVIFVSSFVPLPIGSMFTLITQGVTIVCEDRNRRGGIAKLFLVNVDEIASFTPGGGPDHEYTDVVMSPTAAIFFEFQFEEFEAEHTSETTAERGAPVITHTIDAHIPKMEKVKAGALQAAVDSCKVVAIYENFNGNKFVIGFDEILKDKSALRGAVSEGSGRAMEDPNGYTLTLIGKSGELAREFTGTIPLAP